MKPKHLGKTWNTTARKADLEGVCLLRLNECKTVCRGNDGLSVDAFSQFPRIRSSADTHSVQQCQGVRFPMYSQACPAQRHCWFQPLVLFPFNARLFCLLLHDSVKKDEETSLQRPTWLFMALVLLSARKSAQEAARYVFFPAFHEEKLSRLTHGLRCLSASACRPLLCLRSPLSCCVLFFFLFNLSPPRLPPLASHSHVE